MALNKQNLKVPTSEEARDYGRRGGIASAKARKQKKMMRDVLADLLALPMRDGDKRDNKLKCYADFAKAKNVTIQETILMAQIIKAAKGDTKAASFVRDTIGENITNLNVQAEVQGEIANPYAGLTEEQLRKLAEEC